MHVRRCPRPAFTLVEAVLVVVIVGIFAGIAVPRFSNFLTQQHIDAAARRIVADFALAQRRARLTSTSQRVNFLTGQHDYQLTEFPDPDHPNLTYTVHMYEPPYNATITSVDFGGDAKVVFDGYGVPDTGGTVVLTVGQYQKTLTLDGQTGRVTISGISVVEEPAEPPIEPPEAPPEQTE